MVSNTESASGVIILKLFKFPGFFLEIRNKKGIFSVIPNYIPISEIEIYTFASLEKLFKTILKDWKFI